MRFGRSDPPLLLTAAWPKDIPSVSRVGRATSSLESIPAEVRNLDAGRASAMEGGESVDVAGPARDPAVTPSRHGGSGAPGWRRYVVRDEMGVVLVLVALVVAIGLAHPDFLSSGNLLSTAQTSSYVGLISCGMVFPLAMREVDLSVGGSYALGVVIGAVLIQHGWNPWVAALVVILVCGLLGAANGVSG